MIAKARVDARRPVRVLVREIGRLPPGLVPRRDPRCARALTLDAPRRAHAAGDEPRVKRLPGWLNALEVYRPEGR